MKRFPERLLRLSAWKFALVAAVLIAALAGAHTPAQPSSGSEAQQDAIHNCPQPGKWAISVWSGQDDADAEEAFATCGEGAVAAAYHIDPDTQIWSRWFAARPDVSNLATLDRLQGVLALGGANAPAPLPSGSSAKPYLMDNCPQLGRWAIAIWEGPDGMDADEALDHCLVSLDAAYYIDPQTQEWLRWFRGRPEVSNLTTLNNLQGVIALVPPATAAPLPPPEEVGDISGGGKAVINYRNSTWYTGSIEFQGPTNQTISIDCCTSPAPDILAPPEVFACAPSGFDRTLATLFPGTYSVALRFDDPNWGTHFAGEWTLEADKEYALCFCLGPPATWEVQIP
jgi:hypothetical protein